MKRKLAAGLAIWPVLILFAQTHAQTLSDERFEELHQQLRPGSDDLWRTVPWKTSLLDAQRAAVSNRKPIFIWAMDGHPLGCT